MSEETVQQVTVRSAEIPQARLYTIAEVEAYRQEAYALGWRAAMDSISGTVDVIIDTNKKLMQAQQNVIDILNERNNYDYF